MRIKFQKGKQREFIKKVLDNSRCPSLRLINQFGINTNYQTLKSYYNEIRTLPKELFYNLCVIGKLNKSDFKVKELGNFWGQIKGGKIKKLKI
jgi:hypothetical protein